MRKIAIVFITLVLVGGSLSYLILTNKSFIGKGVSSDTSSTLSASSAGGGFIRKQDQKGKSRCIGLAGSLEMKVLVGPAEAAGMEPVAVGSVPFSVTTSEPPFIVQGGGSVSYQNTLSEVWGTYSVSLEMEGLLEGECKGDVGSEVLSVTSTMEGQQMVEVRASGFQGDYPWEGTNTLELTFPLEEGAKAEGEGWAFILHLTQ